MPLARIGRWPRRLLLALAGLVLLAMALLLLLQLPPVATWAGRRLAGLAPLAPEARLDIGRVTGSWVGGLALHDVVLAREGRRLATIRTVRADYDLGDLLAADRRVEELVVEGARIHARREDGRWDIARAFRSSTDTAAAGGSFAVGRLVLRDASVVAELTPDSVARVEQLELRARELVLGDVPTVILDTLAARLSPPTTPPVWMTLAASGAVTEDVIRLDPLRLAGDRSRIAGRVVLPRRLDEERIVDQLDLSLAATPLALADIAPLVPGLATEGELELEMRAGAEGRRASGRLTGRLGAASLTLEGGALLGPGAPADYRVVGEVRELDPAGLLHTAPAGRINAELSAALRGPSLDRSNGRAELRVRESTVGTTEIGDLRLEALVDSGRADLDLRGSVAGGRLSTTGWVRPFDSIPTYRLAGGATGLPGTDSLAAALVGDEGDPRLEIGFRLAGSGASVDEARATGRATIAAVRAGGTREPLGGAAVELAGRELAVRPELLVAGGRIAAELRARLDDPVTYELRRGRIEGVDLGRLMHDTIAGPLSGRFTASGRGTTPEEAVVRATLTLDELRYGARRLERAVARAALDRGRATLTLEGALQGGTFSAEAGARPFDSVPAFTIRRADMDSVDVGTMLGRPDLAGPVTARLSGSGRWGEGRRELQAGLRIESSRLGRIEVAEGDVTVSLASGRLRYEGALATSAGSLALAGDGRPLEQTPQVVIRRGRADSLDLGALLGREELATRLGARFTGRASGATLDSMRAELALELLPSRVNDAELRSGRADLALDRGVLEGEVRLDGEDGDLLTSVRGTTSGETRRLRLEGAVRVDRLARWLGDTARDGKLAGRFTLEGAADSLGLLGLAGTVTANGTLDSVRLDTLQIALSPGDRVLRLDTVVVRSNVGAFDGGGRLALREQAGADTLRVLGTLLDPSPLMRLAGADTLSLDSARVGLTVTGPTSRRLLRARGTVHRLLYAGNQVERLDLDLGAALDSAGLTGAAGDLRVGGAAAGPVLVREARLAGRYDSSITVQVTALLRDSVAIEAALRGTAVADTLRVALSRLDVAEGGRRWTLEHPAQLEVQPPRIRIGDLALRAGERRLAVDGVLDRAGTSDLAAELRGFDLGALREIGLVAIGGRLDGRARLTGPADGPTLTGELLADVRSENDREAGRVGGKVEWTAAGLALEAAAAHPGGRRLTVTGTLPLRLTLTPADTASAVGIIRQEGDTLGLVARADGFDVAFFEPFIPDDVAERLRGAIALDARVSGTMEQPQVEGTMEVREFAATLPAIGVRYEKGELAARLDEDRLAIERLRLVTDNDGELTASGELRLTPLTNPTLALDAELEDFRVSRSPTLRTIATGRLRLEGTLEVPVMTGTLTLGRTDIISGTETAAAQNVEEIQLTEEDLRQLAREFGPAVLARAEEGPDLVDRFRLDLDVRLPRRVWFRQRGSMKADIEVSGRVRVRQEPGEEMGFFGTVEPVPGRGFLELYGREFRLQRGEITLAGPVEALVLDVTAQYLVQTQADPGDEGILIDVNATGQPDSLQLEFSSDPSMSDEDIVSYIVIGRPASENPLSGDDGGEGQGAAAAGAEVALGRLSESVAGAAGEALGLDVFQIRQDGLRGLTLTAGRYIASRLFLSLQQPIRLSGSEGQTSSGELGPGFELEYTARRWLRANVRGGNVPPRFFFRGRHAF